MSNKDEQRPSRTMEEFAQLVFTSDQKTPLIIEINGKRFQWIGFGWLEAGNADGSEVLITEA